MWTITMTGVALIFWVCSIAYRIENRQMQSANRRLRRRLRIAETLLTEEKERCRDRV